MNSIDNFLKSQSEIAVSSIRTGIACPSVKRATPT